MVAPQLLGGATVRLTLAVVALAVVAAGLAGLLLRSGSPSRRLGIVDAVLLLGVVWTALQALPLPIGWVAWLAPASAGAARASSEALAGLEPATAALSRAPASTRLEVLKGAAICCAFFTGALFANQRRRSLVFVAVASSAAAMAGVALLHAFLAADAVFGLHRPIYTAPLILAPLLNENHFGGFLAMGVPIMLGLGMSEEDARTRLAWYGAAALTGATVFLSLSRGAMAALLGGSVLFILLSSAGRSRRRAKLLRGAALPVMAMVTLGAYVAADQVLSTLDEGTSLKLDLIGRSLAFVGAEPWLGVGRGAFSVAFVEQAGTTSRFVHPENLAAQWATEWGIGFALALALTLSVALVRAFKAAREPAEIGACVGISMLTLQNMVDFSLEMSGVAVVAAALLGATLTPSGRSSVPGRTSARAEQSTNTTGRRRSRIPRLRSATWIWALVSALLLGALAPGLLDSDIEQLTATLSRQFRRGNRDAFAATLKSAVTNHPSEPAFALLAGAEARARSDLRAAPLWLNRAMQLAPGWSAPRLEAAQMFLDVGLEGQAVVELREAASRELETIWESACPLIIRGGAPLAIASAPWGESRLPFLDRASKCSDVRTLASAQIDDAILAEEPNHVAARIRSTRRLLLAGKFAAALPAVEMLANAHPTDGDAQEYFGRTLLAAGRSAEALEHLVAVAPQVTGNRSGVLLTLALAQAAEGQLEDARRSMADVRRLAAGSPQQAARAYDVESSFEEEGGNLGRALRAAEEAQRMDPRPGRLARIGSLARELGDVRRALSVYMELCDRAGGQGPHCHTRDDLEGGPERRRVRRQP